MGASNSQVSEVTGDNTTMHLLMCAVLYGSENVLIFLNSIILNTRYNVK